MTSAYIGRFAPSPTGPLHMGSLVTAMASYLDARAHGGQWLIRMEDVDQARSVAGAADHIVATLAAFELRSDVAVMLQSARGAAYENAFAQLRPYLYPCSCTRKELADSRVPAGTDGALRYPGTCRHGLPAGSVARSWRLRVPASGDAAGMIRFRDRQAGMVCEELANSVGDFVLKRADGCWAYQLAVVVDDAAQGVTHVVRGGDLLESTARQIYLQRLLGVPTPHYLHVPVVTTARGEKLSKQTGAVALETGQPLRILAAALNFLGLSVAQTSSVAGFWQAAIAAWAKKCRDRVDPSNL